MSVMVPWVDLAPGQVERLIAAWLIREFPGAQPVDGAGGDDGADVRLRVPGGTHIFEIKSFNRRLTKSQRGQIAKSLGTALQKQSEIVRWTLVLPIDLSPSEITWFETELAGMTPIPLDWIGLRALESGLGRHRDLLRAYAPGSVEARAMEHLGMYHAEQAALPDGIGGSFERLLKLRDLMDQTDPDYAFDIGEVRPGHVAINVRPKDPGALTRRPLGGSFTFVADADSQVARDYEDFVHYGRPVSIPAENIAAFSLDLPGGLDSLVPEGAALSIVIGRPEGADTWRQPARLVALDGIRALATLAVEWDDSTQGAAGGIWMGGRDQTGFIRVRVRVDGNGLGGLQLEAPATLDVIPSEVLPTLEFLRKLRSADSLRLDAAGYPSTTARFTGPAVGGIDKIDAMIEVAQQLADLYAALGVVHPLPRKWTPDDSRNLKFCNEILRHGTIEWYWPGMIINLPIGSVRPLLQQGPLPRFALTGNSGTGPATIELMGQALTLPGTLFMEVKEALVANIPYLQEHAMPGRPGALLPVVLVGDDMTLCTFTLQPSAVS